MWSLTDVGLVTVKAGFDLKAPSRCLQARPDVGLADKSVWELVLLLDGDGWKHIVKLKDVADAPYTPTDSSTKVWYTQPNDVSIGQNYLHALALGSVPVEHWRDAAYYQSLLHGRHPPSKGLSKWKVVTVDEDDWDAGGIGKVQGTRPKRAPRQRPEKGFDGKDR